MLDSKQLPQLLKVINSYTTIVQFRNENHILFRLHYFIILPSQAEDNPKGSMHSFGLHRTILFKYFLPKFQENARKVFSTVTRNKVMTVDHPPAEIWTPCPWFQFLSCSLIMGDPRLDDIGVRWSDLSYVLHLTQK